MSKKESLSVLKLYRGGYIRKNPPVIKPGFISPSILNEKSIMVIAGEPKAGETAFTLEMMLHAAAGRDFCKYMKMNRPLNILYLQAEMQRERFEQRMLWIQDNVRFSDQEKDNIDKNFMYSNDISQDLCLDADIDDICEAYNEETRDKPDVIVIDPMYLFHCLNENDNSDMKMFLSERITKLRDSLNPSAAVILVHHTRKSSLQQKDNRKSFDDMAGAGVINRFISEGILISYTSDSQSSKRILNFQLRNPMPGEYVPDIVVDRVNGCFVYDSDFTGDSYTAKPEKPEKPEKLSFEDKAELIFQHVQSETEKGNTMTVAELCNSLTGTVDCFNSTRAVRDILNPLIARKLLRLKEKGRKIIIVIGDGSGL